MRCIQCFLVNVFFKVDLFIYYWDVSEFLSVLLLGDTYGIIWLDAAISVGSAWRQVGG